MRLAPVCAGLRWSQSLTPELRLLIDVLLRLCSLTNSLLVAYLLVQHCLPLPSVNCQRRISSNLLDEKNPPVGENLN